MSIRRSPEPCAVVYSGGTDSTCAAALAAERHAEVHLLTYFERGTDSSPRPVRNVERLRAAFPETRFRHETLSTDRLVRFLSYERYLRNIARHGLYILSTPGFSSLSWHVRTLIYCRENGIGRVYDGLTRELMHFPGHMDSVLARFREMYRRFGIVYENPVRDWEVPADVQFLDRLVVDQHGYRFPSEDAEAQRNRTTGRYLYEKGIFPHPDVKGSSFDREMQHDCYPFVLYNIMVFWVLLNWRDYDHVCSRMASLIGDKIEMIMPLIEEHLSGGGGALAPILERR